MSYQDKIGYDTCGPPYPPEWDDELVRCAWCGARFPMDVDAGGGAICCTCQDKIDAKGADPPWTPNKDEW